MQSLNEELSTVNSELQTKVVDLSRANNDMNNLLAGTGIATVFLDYQLRILRFTPPAAKIINLISSDVGRPVGHLASNLKDYAGLTADVQAVLDTLSARSMDVQTTEGMWYSLRILPYRTLDNVIEGAVLTFTDITEMKRAEEKLLRMAVIVRDSRDAITVQGLDGRILAWNEGAARMYGWTEAEALRMNADSRVPKALKADEQDKVHRLSLGKILEPYATKRLTKTGAVADIRMTATALADKAGRMYAIATTERQLGGND